LSRRQSLSLPLSHEGKGNQACKGKDEVCPFVRAVIATAIGLIFLTLG
jgi:hypothetical protein